MDMLLLRKFFPRKYDVFSSDYDVSPICLFSHGTAYLNFKVKVTRSKVMVQVQYKRSFRKDYKCKIDLRYLTKIWNMICLDVIQIKVDICSSWTSIVGVMPLIIMLGRVGDMYHAECLYRYIPYSNRKHFKLQSMFYDGKTSSFQQKHGLDNTPTLDQ